MLSLQSKNTRAEKAHCFCVCLLRTKDKAFDVLLTALEKGCMEHIKNILMTIKITGWVEFIQLTSTRYQQRFMFTTSDHFFVLVDEII